MKKLGVIGGLGPMASSRFYELLTKYTKAHTDQEHLDVYILSCPSIPDRTDYVLGNTDQNPVAPMVEAGNKLDRLGVDYIAIPCITVHFFYDELSRHINAPIINIVQETVNHMKEQNIQRAGIMATDGTLAGGMFQKALNDAGIGAIIPPTNSQTAVMDLIYSNIKANKPINIDVFLSVSEELRSMGSDTVVLACTELSLIKRDYVLGDGYVDALEVLALRSLSLCGAAVRNCWEGQ